MSGGRRPMDVNLAVGSKHWTKAEIEERKRSAAEVPKAEKLTCPRYLNAQAAKLFRKYAKELCASGLPVSRLDTLSLARMCDAESTYAQAAKLRDRVLADMDRLLSGEAALTMDAETRLAELQGDLVTWVKLLGSCEKVARGAANDLGCTVSSRCRLVVPKNEEAQEDPFEALMLRNA